MDEYYLENYKKKRRAVDGTIALLAGSLLILGFALLPVFIQETNWFLIVLIAPFGYLYYRCYEQLQDYHSMLSNEIGRIESEIKKGKDKMVLKTN